MSESTQHKLDRIRPPRVQITYDVEIGDAKQQKELPLVVGIMADLVGQQETPLPKKPKKKERKGLHRLVGMYLIKILCIILIKNVPKI